MWRERRAANVPEQTQTLVVTWYNSAEWSEPQESITMAVMWAHVSFLLWFLGATLIKALKWQHQVLGDLFHLCAVSPKVVHKIRRMEFAVFSWWLQFVLVSYSRIAGRLSSCVHHVYCALIPILTFQQMCGLGPALFSFVEFASALSQRLLRGLAGHLRPILVWPKPWRKQSSHSRWQRTKMAKTGTPAPMQHLSL